MELFWELITILPGVEETENRVHRIIIVAVYAGLLLFWLLTTVGIFSVIYQKGRQIQMVETARARQTMEKAEIERIQRLASLQGPGVDLLYKQGINRRIVTSEQANNQTLSGGVYANPKPNAYQYKPSLPLFNRVQENSITINREWYPVFNTINGVPRQERVWESRAFTNFIIRRHSPEPVMTGSGGRDEGKIRKISIEHNTIIGTMETIGEHLGGLE